MNKKKNRIEFAEALDRRLSGLQGDPWLAQRIMTNEEEKPVAKKISVSVVFACIIIAITISAAFAVGNLFPGIREMLGLDNKPGTEEMIESVDYRWEMEFNTATVREMLYDGQGAYIAVDVHKKDRDDILLIPAADRKLTLRSSASELGKTDVMDGESIAEYAERKGLSVVYFSVMAQNLDKSFSAVTNQGDITSMGEDSWTMVIRFPAVDQDEQINVRLYTTVYDHPLAQLSLANRPLAEPHSITVNVPEFKNISQEKTVMNASSIVENVSLTDLTIQSAKLIQTPIATYIDLQIGNEHQIEYASINANITPLDIEHRFIDRWHFQCPQVFSEGYSSGARVIEIYSSEGFMCAEFQVDLTVSPLLSAEELTETVQYKNAGSVIITFDMSGN